MSGRYEEVVFTQEHDADEPYRLLMGKSNLAALRYLVQWHNPGEHTTTDRLGHGTHPSYSYKRDGYIMTWDLGLPWFNLQYDTKYKKKKRKEEPEVIKKLEEEARINPDAALVLADRYEEQGKHSKAQRMRFQQHLGRRIELSPGVDLWMMGAKYGTIVGTWKNGYVVKLDLWNKRIKAKPESLTLLNDMDPNFVPKKKRSYKPRRLY